MKARMSRWSPICGQVISILLSAPCARMKISRTSVAKRYSEDMLILLRNNHPLLRHPDPRSQLATAQWVLPRANAPARNLLDKAFVTLGLPLPQPTVETGDAAMVRGLLQGSDMLAAVSASQMRFETDNGLLSVLPVPLPDTTRRIGLTFRAGSLPSPATQALLRFIYQQVQDGAV